MTMRAAYAFVFLCAFFQKLMAVLFSSHAAVHGNCIKNKQSVLNNSCPFMVHQIACILLGFCSTRTWFNLKQSVEVA